jgi:hypothetical protein
MMKEFRVESITEIGDIFVASLVDQNGETSLHMFTAEALERFRAGETLPWQMPEREQLGALPPRWVQRVELFTSRREVL